MIRADGIEREWLTPTHSAVEHTLRDGRVRAVERVFHLAIPLREQQVPPDPREAARFLAGAIQPDPLLVRRTAFAGVDLDWQALARQAAEGRTRLEEVDLPPFLPHDVRRALDTLAPAAYTLPSGRSVRLDYRDDGSVLASAKLQELFGLAETPRLGAHRVPITFALLSPAGLPRGGDAGPPQLLERHLPEGPQGTARTLPEVPLAPGSMNAEPTHRTKRR